MTAALPMSLFAFGLNHESAPLDVRERVAFPAERVNDALRNLVEKRPVSEAAILSTCNRTEVYCHTERPDAAIDWLADFHRLPASTVADHLYQLPGEAAVRHAFRVAAGLDSMVLGETQILGQMKQAAKSAETAGTLGWMLHKLFQNSFAVAKDVRAQTEIGSRSVSMAAAAVRLAERIFPDLQRERVLFIGAGEMIELCATHFAAQKPAGITVANRTVERAEGLAQRFGGAASSLNDLPQVLAQHDIIVTSTASPLPIIGKGLIERAIKARRRKPVFIVDLAVPRDVEPEVGQLDDVYLYAVDDLAHIVRENVESRREAVIDAESIIDVKVADFMHWLAAREAVPVVKSLRDNAERTRQVAVEAAVRQLARGDDPAAVVEALSQSLTNKLMHGPTKALSSTADNERGELMKWLARLYPGQHG